MWKIIKSDLEQVEIKKEKFTLSMKWQFKIEFANDSFGPYDYKFGREECYYIDWIDDRWTVKFPLKNKTFDNTEIFLETDDIIICTWERSWLMTDNQTFIDVINLKTEKKQRFFTNEVNLIFNMLDKIFINIEEKWNYKTYILDINTLNILEEKDEHLQAFFKCVYNETSKIWFLVDFKKTWEWYNNWYFEFLELPEIKEIPKNFNREEYKVNLNIDIWELSCK